MSEPKKVVEIFGLDKFYRTEAEIIRVLNALELEVYKGEFLAIVGPSGSGKTTLLNIIGGLDSFDSGSVVVDGVDLSSLKEDDLPEYRNRRIGFIFQHHNLLPEFTALENIIMPLLIRGEGFRASRDRALWLLNEVGLFDRRNHRPSELSGGEKQRVAVLRALITEPSIVLADEPTGNLDEENSLKLLELMVALKDKLGQTIIMVTHDFEIAKKSDRILELKGGKLISYKKSRRKRKNAGDPL